MKILIDKTKVMAFKELEHIRSKICVYDKTIEQVYSFSVITYPMKRISTFKLKY
jgi:hypothetical protein